MKLTKEQIQEMEKVKKKWQKIAKQRGFKEPVYTQPIDIRKKEKYYFEITLPNLLFLQEEIKNNGQKR